MCVCVCVSHIKTILALNLAGYPLARTFSPRSFPTPVKWHHQNQISIINAIMQIKYNPTYLHLRRPTSTNDISAAF